MFSREPLAREYISALFSALRLIVNLILRCGTFADYLIFVVLHLLKVHFLFNSTVSPAIDILVVSASASVLVGREFDSWPGLTKTLNWYCSFLTRRTVCGSAAGNTTRTHKKTRELKQQLYKLSRSATRPCSYKAPTTNHH